MEPDNVKQMFIDVVSQAKKLFRFRLDNFVLMGNHFHFLITPLEGASLSKIMKWILQTFAIRYNKANGLWGHFWGSRFASWIIPTVERFLRIFSYVDQNPVRAGLVTSAGDWPWGAGWFRRRCALNWVDEIPQFLTSVFPDHVRIFPRTNRHI